MKNVLLPAKVLAAARLCEGKGDCRYYLNGVFVDKNRIAATNGHMLFVSQYESDSLDPEHSGDKIEQPVIIEITGNIPSKAYRAYLSNINEERGFIEYQDALGKPVGYGGFKLIDGQYPDIDRLIKDKPTVPVSAIGLNNQYLAVNAKVSKILGSSNHQGGKMEFFGETDSVKITTSTPLYGDVVLIIMPMRL